MGDSLHNTNTTDKVIITDNLRYNFDYCIFGYPNATDVGTSPCQTTTACGQLSSALEDGIPSVGNHSEFAYCSADNSAMTSSSYSQCLSCVSALDATVTVSNGKFYFYYYYYLEN